MEEPQEEGFHRAQNPAGAETAAPYCSHPPGPGSAQMRGRQLGAWPGGNEPERTLLLRGRLCKLMTSLLTMSFKKSSGLL